MHLGRAPGGLPGGLDAVELGPAAALKRVVAAATTHQVHAVAFAGDLVEGANSLFEALGPLHDAVDQLTSRGIEVVAIAGNHDTDALPRLASTLGDRFHLLGTGGTWGSRLIRGEAPLPVRIMGWSFPRPHYRSSPLEIPPPPALPQEVTLGLLHADLDVAQSDYAPVSGSALKAVGYQRWYLGHVHRPDPVTDDESPMYLGSLSPLDPTETMAHGPVLVTVDQGSGITARRLPLAPLRWEHLEIPCPDLADPKQEILPLLTGSMLKVRQDLAADQPSLAALGLRILVRGRTSRPGAVAAACRALQPEDLITDFETTTVFVEKLRCSVSGTYDLQRMAELGDPAGLLARRILALEQGTDKALAERMLVQAADLVQKIHRRREYDLLLDEGETPDRDELGRILVGQAYRILDALMEKGGDGHGSP